MKLIINLQHNLNMSAPIMSRFDLFFILVDDCNEVKLIFNKLFFFKVGISKTLLLFTLPLNIPLTKQMKGTKERKEFSDLSLHAQNYTPAQNWLEHFLGTKSMMVLHPSPPSDVFDGHYVHTILWTNLEGGRSCSSKCVWKCIT